MAVAPESIQRFINWNAPPLPDFKRMTEPQLLAHIKRVTQFDFDPKTPCYLHQLAGVAAAVHAHKILLHYEMRLGKTKLALDWAEHFRRCGTFRKKGLVITPFPLATGEFVADAEIHSRLKVVGVFNSLDELTRAVESDADVIVVCWHHLQHMLTVKAKHKNKTIMAPDIEGLHYLAEYFDLAIIDEIHECNNTGSMRFQMATILVAHCHYRIGMSGTPINKEKFSIWAQAFLVDEGKTLGKSEYFFQLALGKKKKNYWTKSGFETVFDDDKSEVLVRKLSAISLAYELAEVRAVNVIPGVVALKMLAEQRQRYKSVIDQVIESHKLDLLETQNTFVKLRQISSGFMPFVDGDAKDRILKFPSVKLTWLDELLGSLPADLPFVIFYEFTESGKSIDALLSKHGISHSWLWSGTKDRTKALRDFQQGRATALLANTRSAWGAVDLQRADYQLFFESTVSPIMRKQVEFRALGPARGDRPLPLDDLICSPVERRILEFLKQGKDAMETVIFTREAWKTLL